MEDLSRVSEIQLYSFWKNLSTGLLAIIGIMTFSRVLPFYASPVVSLLAAAFLYTILFNSRRTDTGECTLVTYSIFISIVNYSVASIILSLLDLWHLGNLPHEFSFFCDPYLPSLVLHPCCFLTLSWIYIRRKNIKVCRECRLRQEGIYERGKAGAIFKHESYFQLRNLIALFAILTVVVWSYYLFVYIAIDTNARDWYVFAWITVLAFIIDEVYFIYRYYNLYLDLKENNEIISPDEIQNMTAKTYLRFYVISGNMVYLDPHSIDRNEAYKEVIDTPFVTKRSVNGIPLPEVKSIIKRFTGVDDGELRFFYGRRTNSHGNVSVLRYFYFLKDDPGLYTEMPTAGEWMDFEVVKRIYTRTPGKMANMALADLSRLATIILTEKIFDENGRRKNRIKSYRTTFTLRDVQRSQLDFQDDKWIRVSMFNSDQPFFAIKRLFKGKQRTQGNPLKQDY